MCRLLIDTNVLLDAVVRTSPGHASARELLNRCNSWDELGMASALSFKDVYRIGAKAKGEWWARDAVRNLMNLLVVVPVDTEVCYMALNSDEPDFEDAIIRASAELNDADFIITRDTSAFDYSKVRAVSAAKYLEIAGAQETRG